MSETPAPRLQEEGRSMSLSWRGGQVYLMLLAIISLIAAGWVYGYWSRLGRGAQRAKIAERLPEIVRDNVARHGVGGAVETPAVALWLHGPYALPLIAAAAGLGVLALRRRKRWALVVTVLVAIAAIPVAYGGTRALHGLEDRHFYARLPYVRTYRALSIPLVAGSAAFLVLVGVEAGLRLRRRKPAEPVETVTP